MRRSYASAQKSIALLTIVGTIIGSHGSSSSQTSYSQLRVRSMTSIHVARRECKHTDSSHPALETVSPISSSSAASAAVLCARGGAIDDDPQRRRGYERDDRLPPRRSSPSYNNYDREDRGLRGDSRGSDPRKGGGSRPQGDRDRRYSDDRSYGNREFRGDKRSNYDERDRRERNPRNYQPNNIDPDGSTATAPDGKSKKWFTLKKDKAKSSPKSKNDEQTEFDPRSNGSPIPPPPPPPPIDSTIASSGVEINPAETQRTPIHYNFPTAEAAAEERKFSDEYKSDGATGMNAPDIPFLDVEEDEFGDREGSKGRQRRRRIDDDDDERFRASPRRDAVTMFMSSRRGAVKVRLGSMIVGAALGGFIGKSLMNDPFKMSIAMASFLFVTGFLRNDYGELSRALGLAFVFTLQRTGSVRKDYPTLPHLKAMIRQGPRKPFPPVEDGISPWKYEPIYRDDPEFKMTYALLAMALVGSFCGGNVPILPAWIGGIVGALAFASLTTGGNARGDLGRSMGMRVVGLVQLVLAINSDLRILGKAATVGGLMFDKVMIMDRKHRIKDRIVVICKWGYDKVSNTAEQVKEEMQDERPERRR
eukprot:CAMPEP_0172305902 /NCGR_PEP_ID=MMETSP1058-20130122/7099_1 /TAXON_ID=83371 /ORGANISM="Detonula confervacea, Strain CCMP 353" /LENGTH=590 /DNA_ID=CAMNT_0013017643 /DNA_START=103 /DNA_END=1875 /DNA_ORIENTATION=-